MAQDTITSLLDHCCGLQLVAPLLPVPLGFILDTTAGRSFLNVVRSCHSSAENLQWLFIVLRVAALKTLCDLYAPPDCLSLSLMTPTALPLAHWLQPPCSSTFMPTSFWPSHLLFPQPGYPFPQISAWLAPLPPLALLLLLVEMFNLVRPSLK